jgi:diguanylate cyclase (GGDEF)-like protein
VALASKARVVVSLREIAIRPVIMSQFPIYPAMTRDERVHKHVGIPSNLALGALVAIVAGMLAPLLVGFFNTQQALALVAIESACLLTVGSAGFIFARRLRAHNDDLWALSRRDELTGVGNYRALRERLDEEIARHARREREFALVLIDLNDFKQVNDELGHLEGDRLLAEVGAALLAEVRGEDPVFRQGGDEFAVIVPETNGEEAEEMTARLRARVRNCGAGGTPISAGTGFAIFPADGRAADELFRHADHNLIGAKRTGRASGGDRRYPRGEGRPLNQGGRRGRKGLIAELGQSQ